MLRHITYRISTKLPSYITKCPSLPHKFQFTQPTSRLFFPIVSSAHFMSTVVTPSQPQTPAYTGSRPDFNIATIRCFDDNNCYVLRDSRGFITLVDPAEPNSVLNGLRELNIDLNDAETVKKTQIITTHHHWDHSGGNDYFFAKYNIPIAGGAHDKIPHASLLLEHDQVFTHGDLTFHALHTPCHTKGHLCVFFYHSTPENQGLTDYKAAKGSLGIFTGDTLFSGGCGKFFEGTAKEMFPNMSLFWSLPDRTYIYDGHEYTKSNLAFALKLDPKNEAIKQQLDWISHNGTPTHPTNIGMEKQVNIFLRARDEAMLSKIRTQKDKGDFTPLPNDYARQFE